MEKCLQHRKTTLGPELGHTKRVREIMFRVNPEHNGQGRMSLSCIKGQFLGGTKLGIGSLSM